MMAMMKWGGDEGGGGQLKLAVVTLGNVHLVSGAVTNDGHDGRGGDGGVLVGQLKLAVAVRAGHIASDTVTK